MSDETIIIPSGPASPKRAATPPPPPPPPPPPEPPSSGGPPPRPPRQKRSRAVPLFVAAAAVLLTGLAATLGTISALSPRGAATSTTTAAASGQAADATPAEDAVSDSDLDEEIAPVADNDTEASDEALISSVVAPAIVELSGDPIVVKTEPGRERQLVRLTGDAKREAAAQALGAKGPVFRLSDMLDGKDRPLANGVLGAQQDFALFQTSTQATDAVESAPDDPQAIAERGSTTLAVGEAGFSRQQYARRITSSANLSSVLGEFGLDAEGVANAAKAFQALYGISDLKAKDAVGVMAVKLADTNALVPAQISLYRDDAWLGTVAMTETGGYSKGEDPWYEKNLFEAELLPETAPRAATRLMEAIYSAALRNGLPAPVAGETIMMLSRAYDLEQQVQPGDAIAILFSDAARDNSLGMGRVIYVKITRASGNFECYVSQPASGQPFACVTGAVPQSFDAAGLVVPVNGTITAKFGPQDQKSADGADSSAAAMNYGVDWTAPAGTPVVSATAGKVTAAGQEAGKGNVLRITGDDGSEASYAYLQKFAPGIAIGVAVTPGQQIGFVGTPPDSREPKLHFELRRNGQPVDPVPEMADTTIKGSAVDIFVGRIIHIESANRCDARNPLSTAVGLGQFIESTWMTTIRLHRPDILNGRSRAEVLALRTNCELARAMTAAFTADNAAVIRSRGHPVTPGNLYLAHFLGVGGALKALSPSNQGQLISEVFGQKHVNANPFERGKTVGFLVTWAAQKMARAPGSKRAPVQPKSASPSVATAPAAKGTPADERKTANAASPATAPEQPAQPAADNSPLARQPDDPHFAELRRNVDILMR